MLTQCAFRLWQKYDQKKKKPQRWGKGWEGDKQNCAAKTMRKILHSKTNMNIWIPITERAQLPDSQRTSLIKYPYVLGVHIYIKQSYTRLLHRLVFLICIQSIVTYRSALIWWNSLNFKKIELKYWGIKEIKVTRYIFWCYLQKMR